MTKSVNRSGRLFVSPVGFRDPYWDDGGVEPRTTGPVLGWLGELETKDHVRLVATRGTTPNAHETRLILLERHPKLDVQVLETDIEDPTCIVTLVASFSTLWTPMAKLVTRPENRFVCLSPGTPQMQVAWILLAMGGRIDARLQRVRSDSRTGQTETIDLVVGELRGMFDDAVMRGRKTVKDGLRQLHPRVGAFIGTSPQATKVREKIESVASYDINVLLQGETGTGKELLARQLHFSSPRRNESFLPVNCANLNVELLEAELFGSTKGAFTGAVQSRRGLVAEADGGTLFLDEIAELTLPVQSKLLRFLETGEYRPLGGDRNERADIRLVSAANTCLSEKIDRGEFRSDLYYRICGCCIEVPRLVDRDGDVRLLLDHFLRIQNLQHGRKKHFTPDALKLLLAHDWPGNVRELQQAVKECFVVSGDVITVDDVPSKIARPRPSVEVDALLTRSAEEVYRRCLEEASSLADAARMLGLKPHTFRKRLRENFPELKAEFEGRRHLGRNGKRGIR